jgi:hypothetical protein
VRAHEQTRQLVTPSLAAVVDPTGDLVFAPIEGALVAAEFEPEDSGAALNEHLAGVRPGTRNRLLALLPKPALVSTGRSFQASVPSRGPCPLPVGGDIRMPNR